MKQLIVLGTGNANVKECYNTCFALKEGNEYFLVDAGGGNRILKQLDSAHIPLTNIHHLFVSHAHTDHVLGVVWLIRMIASQIISGKYQGSFHIYCHQELIQIIQTLCLLTLQKKLVDCFGNIIIFHDLKDGQTIQILNHPFTFFDILSTKMKQYGFTFINPDGCKLAFAGDEPYNQNCYQYISGANWLLHEAFCLYRDKDIYKPYEKHHSTVKDAAILATTLGIQNLVLWHTEEDHLQNRKKLYTHEAQQYFNGCVYVPDDLDILDFN